MVTRRALFFYGLALGFSRRTSAKSFTNNMKSADEMHCGYLIAGCGASGLVAAITAAEHGVKNIVVIEKEPIVGGSSILCEGVWSLAGTPFQKLKRIQDSEQNFIDNLLEDSKGTSNPSIVRKYVANCLDQYEWFNRKKIQPREIIKNTGMNVPRGHTFDPLEVFSCLRKSAQILGIKVLVNTKAEELLFDRSGRVSGLVVRQKGEKFSITSDLGVLLATGGFSRNEILVEKYAPKMKNAVRLACAGAQGDGLLLALGAGADVCDIHNIRAAYGFILNPSSVFDISQTIYSGAIILNNQGLRFVNESLPYKEIGEIALGQPLQRSYMVFDSKILRDQMGDRAADALLFAPLLKNEVPHFMFAGDTLTDVARKARLPIENVIQSVDSYNRYVEKGLDEDFGRRHLTLDYGQMKKIQVPPFYIVPTTCASMGTNGGIRVDENTRVLRKDGSPIEGLYAAGEMMGGLHGNSFMGGTSYGKALVFGRVNGLHISELYRETMG